MTQRARTRRTADPHAAEIGPRVVGGDYHNDGSANPATSQPVSYRVVGLTRSTHEGWSLRVLVTDGPETGQVRYVDTPWDDQHDTVIHHNGGTR